VHDLQLGASLRALRRRRSWRQSDLAAAAGVSQTLVSSIERGHLDGVAIATLRRVMAGLDAKLELGVRWRGGSLDCVVDERHASLVGRVVEILRSVGWLVRVEASYAHYGERGSVDVLGLHEITRTLLVVEVKSELTSIEATLRKLDEKARLAGVLARDSGWRADRTARLIVLPATTTARRAVVRHGAVLDVAAPLRGGAFRAWLNRPAGQVSGLLFVADTTLAPGKHRKSAPHRVRIPRASTRLG
jgi:transcriptional regulator with XRE-family HTH domain